MFMLQDEQIVTRLAPVTESGPLVVTSLRGATSAARKKIVRPQAEHGNMTTYLAPTVLAPPVPTSPTTAQVIGIFKSTPYTATDKKPLRLSCSDDLFTD